MNKIYFLFIGSYHRVLEYCKKIIDTNKNSLIHFIIVSRDNLKFNNKNITFLKNINDFFLHYLIKNVHYIVVKSTILMGHD